MDSISLNAHAKINLSLEITGRRPDGYHEIVSFMQGTGLADRVEIKFCPQNGTKYNLPHCLINGIVVYLCTDAKTIPTGMDNLAFKGLKVLTDCAAFKERCAKELPELMVTIEKKLPVAAGIAGGSGNAAACMLGLNALLGHPLSLRELMAAGAAAGADVPFSLFMNAYRNKDALAGLPGIEEAADSAWTSGIGDIVEAADPVPRHVILANPGTGVSTKTAYEAMDRIGYADSDPSAGRLFVNDMEKYTLAEKPEAAELRRVMESSIGADEVLMSGSGPTIVAYYREDNIAEEGRRILSELMQGHEGFRMWRTTTGI